MGTIPKVVRKSRAKNRHEGVFVNKVRGNALISIPADIRWQKMSGWRLDFGGEETRIIMKNEWYLLLFNPVYELPEAKPCVLS